MDAEIQQVLERIGQLEGPWRVRNECIERPDEHYTCPLCALAGVKGYLWDAAATQLGIPFKVAQVIARAADCRRGYDPEIRAALLAVTVGPQGEQK